MAIVTPGTGLFEVGAFFCLALAGYAVYNLSFNWWALVILVLSIVPFIYAIQKPKRELYLGLSILLLVIGSVFLFAVDGWKPAVNPFVALVTSGLMSVFLWIVVRKTVQAAGSTPVHDLETLIGSNRAKPGQRFMKKEACMSMEKCGQPEAISPFQLAVQFVSFVARALSSLLKKIAEYQFILKGEKLWMSLTGGTVFCFVGAVLIIGLSF